jgi:hypothetical protein
MLFGIASAPAAERSSSTAAVGPVAVLTVISGGVLMRTPGADFSSALDGAVLYVGTVLRTSTDARALITLFEGSTVELDPASDITIEAATARGGSTFADAFGRGLRVVMQLTTADSRYEPTTPAATASVRGIDFDVEVAGNVLPATLVPIAARVTTTAVAPTGVQIAGPAHGTATRANTSLSTMRATSKSVRKALAESLLLRLSSMGRARDGDDDDREDED